MVHVGLFLVAHPCDQPNSFDGQFKMEGWLIEIQTPSTEIAPKWLPPVLTMSFFSHHRQNDKKQQLLLA